MGITEVFSKVDSALEANKGLIKEQLPKPDLSFFGKDADLFDLDSTDRKQFEDREYPKFVAKFLTDTLGEGGITAEMLKAIDQADLNQMIRDIQAVIGSNITATQIQKGINQFIGATK
tara:strand:- start:3816 stop:4169 length:354 start_codon:yes stop_codon:yes gene_type:complete